MDLPSVGDAFVGRYVLDAVLGAGGFATVYRASDRSAGRAVAVKVLHPGKTGRYERDLEARFQRELRALERLKSPYIVQLLDHGRTPEGLLFLVMELVPGADLSAMMGSGRGFDPGEVAHVLRQVLRGLAEAHRHGILHRDLKPANIRIFASDDDRLAAKLLDFGIAVGDHLEVALTSATKTGQIVGTPRYMSPEQLSERELTPSSDLYSLGVVAFEMLAGNDHMHGGTWGDQLDRMMTGHVFTLPHLGQEGAQLLTIIQKMTVRNVNERYRSADAVLRDLDAAFAQVGTARDVPTIPRMQPAMEDATTRVRGSQGKNRAAVWAWGVGAIGIGALGMALLSDRSESASKNPGNVEPVLVAELPVAEQRVSDRVAADAAVGHDATSGPEYTTPLPIAAARPDKSHLTGARKGCEIEPFVRGLWEDFPSDETGERVPPGFTWIPTSYQVGRPYPVVVLLHRNGDTGLRMLERTQFISVAGDDAIMVAPTFPIWAKVTHRPQLQKVLTWLSDHFCIDPHRIFMVTHGAAGVVAEMNQCGPMLTALAVSNHRPYEGTGGQAIQSLVNLTSEEGKFEPPQCTNLRPIPTILFSPLNSRVLPRDRNTTPCDPFFRKMTLVDYEAQWRTTNHCAQTREAIEERDGATCWQWNDCAAELISCHIPGKAGWPGSKIGFTHICEENPEPHGFPASERIWEFFQRAPPSADGPEIVWKPRPGATP